MVTVVPAFIALLFLEAVRECSAGASVVTVRGSVQHRFPATGASSSFVAIVLGYDRSENVERKRWEKIGFRLQTNLHAGSRGHAYGGDLSPENGHWRPPSGELIQGTGVCAERERWCLVSSLPTQLFNPLEPDF